MSKLITILIVFFWPFLVHSQDKSLVIQSVTVIDMVNGNLQPNMTVVITGNKITAVSKKAKAPKNATIIEAKGKFLIPGLWDMHVHTLRQQEFNTDNFLSLFIANGITGVREMGNSPLSITEVRRLRKQIETGESIGPRMLVSGPLIDGRPSGWKSTVIVTTEPEGRAVVDSLKEAGVDFIKVYSSLSPPVYFAIADQAKKQGIAFAGHMPQAVTALEASNAGQKSFEHLFGILQACSYKEEYLRQQSSELSALKTGSQEWLDKWSSYNQVLLNTYDEGKAKELFSLLRKNNTWQCPALTERYANSHFIESSQANQDRLKYLSNDIKDFWIERTEFRKKNNTPASIELLKKRYQKELQLVGAMSKAGVPLLAGSDDLNPYVFPGFSLHDELSLLVEAGLTPLQALQTVTLNPAKYFSMSASLGTVEEGKLADLLLLDANPLENIHNTKSIAGVVANGRYFSKEDLSQMLSEAQSAANKQ